LTVNVTSGFAVTVFDALAVRTQCAPTSGAGSEAKVCVRSPLTVAPTCRLVCSDQLAALALSLTVRLLRLRPPGLPPPTGGNGAWVQFSSPLNADSSPALLTMLAGTPLAPLIVVLFATVTPLPVLVPDGFWKKLSSTSVGSRVVVCPGR
jgi:hypothetical protein